MAGTRGWSSIAALVWLCGAALDANDRPTLVFHIDDRVAVPPHELAAARIEGERIFMAAGVDSAWAEGRFPVSLAQGQAATPRARHVAVMVVNNDAASTRGAAGCALGFATPRLAVAYVFYNRVVEASRTRPVDLTIALGRVIAHEVGHVLLPPNSHASYGIMRADLDFGFVNPNRFTDDQARAIRAELADRSRE